MVGGKKNIFCLVRVGRVTCRSGRGHPSVRHLATAAASPSASPPPFSPSQFVFFFSLRPFYYRPLDRSCPPFFPATGHWSPTTRTPVARPPEVRTEKSAPSGRKKIPVQPVSNLKVQMMRLDQVACVSVAMTLIPPLAPCSAVHSKSSDFFDRSRLRRVYSNTLPTALQRGKNPSQGNSSVPY